MGALSIMQHFSKYAHSVGATRKVMGGHAYRSPNYNERNNTGRYVSFKSAKRGGDIIVHDNKRGDVKIGKTDDYMGKKDNWWKG
jgi:hypothetical protein